MAAGILASNPHNSQPWLFRISAATIDLFADPIRQIGVIDPFRSTLAETNIPNIMEGPCF